MRINKVFVCLGLALLASSSPHSSRADEVAQPNSSALPELVVLARRRPETASAVPLQVQSLPAEGLAALHLDQMDALSTVVPGLQISDSGTVTRLSLRGIGSGSNPGFEQSVGFYVDGIHFGRQAMARLPLLDIERVEVLHGPQAILLGKNSIAGAITIHTASPSAKRSTLAGVRMEPFSHLREGTLIHNTGALPISGGDHLQARVALRSNKSEGALYNPARALHSPQQEAYSGRAQIHWHKVRGQTWGLSAEQHRLVADGRDMHTGPDLPGSNGNLRAQWQAAALPYLPSLSYPGPLTNAPEPRTLKQTRLSFTLTHSFPEAAFEAHSALLRYHNDEVCDCDYLPYSLFTTRQQEQYRQFSHELRLSGDGQRLAHWQAGLYLQSHRLMANDALHLPNDSLLPGILQPRLPHLPLNRLSGTAAWRLNEQSGDLFAWYAQSDLNLLARLQLSLGLRYTREWRRARRLIDINTDGGMPGTMEAVPWLYEQLFAIYNEQAGGHRRQGAREESAWLPLISLQWQRSTRQQFYISARRGHKAGGFDARANQPDSFEFMPERAQAFELGIRQSFPVIRAQLSSTLFRTHYRNLQMSQFDGVLGFNVANAADTQIQGLDLSLHWQARPSLSLQAEWTWLDARFQHFPAGNCYSGQPAENGPYCAQDGRRLQWAPPFQGRLELHYHADWGSLPWEVGLQLTHDGAQNIHDNLDPRMSMPSHTIWHVFASTSVRRWHWRASLHNPLAREVFTYASSVPLSHALFGSHSYVRYRSQPRALHLSLKHDF